MQEIILQSITEFFIESAKRGEFNGLTASSLISATVKIKRLRSELSNLVREHKITAIFSRDSVNMHIKRFPELPVEAQIRLLAKESVESFCLYPTSSAVEMHTDISSWQDRPFSKALVLAEPQLSFRAFDMGALERYIADPRYKVHFSDYMGSITVTDDSFIDDQYPERDKIYLKTFGIGFDKDRVPYAIVFLRYLSTLSAEHQQYWHSFLVVGDVRMSEPYFRSSIEGRFWKNRSVRHAIEEEMRLIGELSKIIWGKSLFRLKSDDDVAIGLTSFLRPTEENFNRFVLDFDKLLSEALDVKFFIGKVLLETETDRSDGKIVVQKKGSLALLEEWLLLDVKWDDPEAFKKIVIQPLREIRRLRQKPAHSFTPNIFATTYREERKRLLWNVLNSLANIRATFKRHPEAISVQVPEWLDNDRIDVF